MSDTNDQKARERAELNNALTNPILLRAFEGALCDLWKDKRGQPTIEGSAMAFHQYDGACELIARLYDKASVKPQNHVAPRRIRHNAL